MTDVEIMGDYEKETGNVIVERFKTSTINPIHTPGVLVKNHGPFAWGKDAYEAVYHAVVLEHIAKMTHITYSLNPKCTMNEFLTKKHFSRKHGPDKYYGQ